MSRQGTSLCAVYVASSCIFHQFFYPPHLRSMFLSIILEQHSAENLVWFLNVNQHSVEHLLFYQLPTKTSHHYHTYLHK